MSSEPRAGCDQQAGCEPRAVNRRQCVNLAVYKGRSLCEGVFLKGPGRLCPRLKGWGPLGWFLLKQRRKHMALLVVGGSSALCRQPWPFSDFSGSFGNLMEVVGTSQRKTQCLACDFSSLRACGSLCELPVQGRGSPQGEGRGEGPPPSPTLGCFPVCLSVTLAHHPVLATSGLNILVRIHMDAVVCLWGFLIAFLRCNLDANKKPPV